ncbi:MAG: tRNA (N6-isopentenyl adenosine(37)-C2)-methylthiotransferase MiaB [Caldisericia bacterium]|nr:tRNA (N6-isopentenyl adenosine(37)-C2)-methylthiotransferase MiaB [Caldisericia bacterium]
MLFFLYTIGCQMNEYDTDVYRHSLSQYGFQPTEDPYMADFIMVNTCAVRDKSLKKAVSFLGIAAKIKKEKPSLMIALTGCASTLILKELKNRSYIDFVWGALNQTEIPDKFSALLEKKGFQKTDKVQTQHSIHFTKELPIIFGCDSFCTYCIVPYLRGHEKSLPKDYLLSELDKTALAGYKEVLLLGQNVNHYGSDLDPSLTFAGLLQIMAETYPAIRFDFLTSHPKDFDIQILQVMQNNPNIYRHFHLPAQHGDNEILQKMNRGYTKETYLELITTIRSFFPMATLSTDLIVGFPGETDTAFEHTLDLIETVQFDMIFAAQYSKRPGTPAEAFPDQVPETTKRERINTLLEAQKRISKINNRRWVGRRCKLIITGKGQEHHFFGKTEEEKTVSIVSDSLVIGMEVNALIKKIDNGSLIAEAWGYKE